MLLQAGGRCYFAAAMTLLARCGQPLHVDYGVDKALLVYATTVYNCSYQINDTAADDDVYVSNTLGVLYKPPPMELPEGPKQKKPKMNQGFIDLAA